MAIKVDPYLKTGTNTYQPMELRSYIKGSTATELRLGPTAGIDDSLLMLNNKITTVANYQMAQTIFMQGGTESKKNNTYVLGQGVINPYGSSSSLSNLEFQFPQAMIEIGVQNSGYKITSQTEFQRISMFNEAMVLLDGFSNMTVKFNINKVSVILIDFITNNQFYYLNLGESFELRLNSNFSSDWRSFGIYSTKEITIPQIKNGIYIFFINSIATIKK